jgi:hypothetical protein
MKVGAFLRFMGHFKNVPSATFDRRVDNRTLVRWVRKA